VLRCCISQTRHSLSIPNVNYTTDHQVQQENLVHRYRLQQKGNRVRFGYGSRCKLAMRRVYAARFRGRVRSSIWDSRGFAQGDQTQGQLFQGMGWCYEVLSCVLDAYCALVSGSLALGCPVVRCSAWIAVEQLRSICILETAMPGSVSSHRFT
jgi:hypothetical protein